MQGEYFTFVDSDDCIAVEMYSVLMKAAEKFNADIVSCNHQWGQWEIDESEEVSVLSGSIALKNMFTKNREDPEGFGVSTWDKIYRSEFRKVMFRPELYFAEDRDWLSCVFYQSDTVVKVNKTLYYYFQNESSLTHANYNSHKCLGNAFCYERIAKMCAENLDSELAQLFCGMYIDSMIRQYIDAENLATSEEIKDCRKKIEQHMDNISQYIKYCGRKTKIKVKLWNISPKLILKLGALQRC